MGDDQPIKPFCIAIDWGTSNFRLWLLSEHGNPMIVRRSDEGFQLGKSTGFENIVERYLDEFGIQSNIPIIVCGMAGANQGWREAPYVKAPVSLDQVLSNSVSVPHRSRDVRILPGIAQRSLLDPDVIRGQETRLLGVLEHIPQNGFVCMPGTHSRWIYLEQGMLKHFSTFFTGELFGLLANHSTLKLQQGVSLEIVPSSHAFHRAFNETVDNPHETTNRLFRISASNLLGYSSPNSNAAELSGCILGLEFSGVQSKYGPVKEVSLVASKALGKLYASALNSRGTDVRFFDAEEAVIKGLYKSAKAIWPD
ncbi:MAG: 2-dehydro-3-deoxygalactonokinase [bacterium]|nr:2-dehydro-3-deoxygalactonokinase [bacterium]